MFLSKGDAFEGLNDHLASISQAITLDNGLLDIDAEAIQAISDIEFLRIKKNLLIKQCAQKNCIKGFKVVDIFNNGYVAELELALKKELICLVESIEDQKKLEISLLPLQNQQMRSQFSLAMTIKEILSKKDSNVAKCIELKIFLMQYGILPIICKRSFLCMMGFYQKYVKDHTKIAALFTF